MAVRLALADPARVIVIVYVFVVVPSCAVTTVVITFAPTLKAWLVDGDPETAAAPFTVTVAVPSAVVGVRAMDDMLFATDAV